MVENLVNHARWHVLHIIWEYPNADIEVYDQGFTFWSCKNEILKTIILVWPLSNCTNLGKLLHLWVPASSVEWVFHLHLPLSAVLRSNQLIKGKWPNSVGQTVKQYVSISYLHHYSQMTSNTSLPPIKVQISEN